MKLLVSLILLLVLPSCVGLWWPQRTSRLEYDPVTGKIIYESSTPLGIEQIDTEATASRPGTESQPGQWITVKQKRAIDGTIYADTRAKEAEALRSIGEKLIETAGAKIP